MERHAALPDIEHLNRTLDITAEVVKQDVSEAASYHDSKYEKEQQVVEIVGRHRQFFQLGQALQQEVSRDERNHVHQAVPPKLHGAEMQKDRIDVWKLKLQYHHASESIRGLERHGGASHSGSNVCAAGPGEL